MAQTQQNQSVSIPNAEQLNAAINSQQQVLAAIVEVLKKLRANAGFNYDIVDVSFDPTQLLADLGEISDALDALPSGDENSGQA